jgi:hypothetical protein
LWRERRWRHLDWDHLVEESTAGEAANALRDHVLGDAVKLREALAVDVALTRMLELVADQCGDPLKRAVDEDGNAAGVDAVLIVHLLKEWMDLDGLNEPR